MENSLVVLLLIALSNHNPGILNNYIRMKTIEFLKDKLDIFEAECLSRTDI